MDRDIQLGARLRAVAGDRGVRLALACTLGLRLVAGAVAAIGLAIAPPATRSDLPALSGGLSDIGLAPWMRWDYWHFASIAGSGYPYGSTDAAFFPLFPAAERLCAVLVGGSLVAGGLIAATVSTGAALVLIHRLVSIDFSQRIADLTVVIVTVSPMGFFLVAPYSESLFLALAAGGLLAARRNRPLIAGVVIALASLTRPPGVLLAIPALVIVAPGLITLYRAHDYGRIIIRAAAISAIPAAAFVAWVVVATYLTGLSPFQAEEQGWHGHTALPWQGLIDSLTSVAIYPGPLINVATVVLWCILIWMAVRRNLPAGYVAYMVIGLLPIVLRENGFGNPWASAPRFALVVFPLATTLAVLGDKRPRWLAAGICLSILAGVASVITFSHNYFIA